VPGPGSRDSVRRSPGLSPASWVRGRATRVPRGVPPGPFAPFRVFRGRGTLAVDSRRGCLAGPRRPADAL